MLDIFDVLVARALNPSVEIDRYAAIAQKAVADSNRALTNANSALAIVDKAVIGSLNNEIDKISLIKTTETDANGNIVVNLSLTFPSGLIKELSSVAKYYTKTGNNIDGTMTQKAITDELNEIKNRLEKLET